MAVAQVSGRDRAEPDLLSSIFEKMKNDIASLPCLSLR
jgi:hypothetical protein